MLSADVCNNGSFAADDFGVILRVHSDGQLEAPECLSNGHSKNELLSFSPSLISVPFKLILEITVPCEYDSSTPQSTQFKVQ